MNNIIRRARSSSSSVVVASSSFLNRSARKFIASLCNASTEKIGFSHINLNHKGFYYFVFSVPLCFTLRVIWLKWNNLLSRISFCFGRVRHTRGKCFYYNIIISMGLFVCTRRNSSERCCCAFVPFRCITEWVRTKAWSVKKTIWQNALCFLWPMKNSSILSGLKKTITALLSLAGWIASKKH